MFELAAAAACTPSHEDWLNDLSLIVPVSATIQARNLAACVPEAGLDDELGLAHPAASKATAANAAAARKACLTCYLLVQSACRPLRPDGGPHCLMRTAGPLLRPGAPMCLRSLGACFGMIAV